MGIIGQFTVAQFLTQQRHSVRPMEKCKPCTAATPLILHERRSGTDRRKKRFSLVLRLFRPGRRGALRREADRRGFYLLDFYSPRIFYAMTTVLLLSVIDAYLTLWLLGEGATELNPVMAYFLKSGPLVFVAAKYAMTSVSVVIVVLLNYICIKQVRFQFGRLLDYFAGCFAMVVAWEVLLILRHLP